MPGATLSEIRKAQRVYREMNGAGSPILTDAEFFITETDGPLSAAMAAFYGENWRAKLAEHTIHNVQLAKREALWEYE